MTNDHDDQFDSGSNKPKDSQDSELGNLPPLSDFDSGAGFESNLPPLDSFEPPAGKPGNKDDENEAVGGLPPFSDISIETPNPTGGNIKPPPPGFDEIPSAFDTPASDPAQESTGFQDLAADSDFSPETPDIGPGPDSDMDTPMFDSAFGGGGAEGYTPTFDTPAPTQAMETPIFGEDKGAQGGGDEGLPAFDEGAFQGGGFDLGGGTPAPDFTPDSTLAKKADTPEAKPKKVKKQLGRPMGSTKGMLIAAGIAFLLFVVGLGVGPFLSTKMAFIPNPLKSVVEQNETKITELESKIKSLVAVKEVSGPTTPETIEKLLAQQEELNKSIAGLQTQETDAQAKLEDTTKQLDDVSVLLDEKNEEFSKAQEAYEDLQNQTAIVQAQQQGLVAEVERLTGLVDELDLANLRRQATKETLQHSVNRLLAEIKEGLGLTPAEFSRTGRVAKVEDLQKKINEAKWVTPEILNEYTDLYTQELQIAASSSYFFAKLPLTNGLGQREMKWAECLMRGNWAVYYRSIDGKNVGIYRNISGPNQVPEYAFIESLPGPVKKQVSDEVVASRVEDFEEKFKVVAQKQDIIDGHENSLQRVFQSL